MMMPRVLWQTNSPRVRQVESKVTDWGSGCDILFFFLFFVRSLNTLLDLEVFFENLQHPFHTLRQSLENVRSLKTQKIKVISKIIFLKQKKNEKKNIEENVVKNLNFHENLSSLVNALA